MQGPRVTSLAWVTNHEWVLYPFLKFLFKLFFTEKYLFYLSCTYYVISCIFIKHVVASTYEEIKNFPFRLLVEVFLSFLGLTTDWDNLFLGLRKLYYTRNYLINHECTDQEICPGACVNLLTRGRGRPIFNNFYTFSFKRKRGADPLKLPVDPCMYDRRVCNALGVFSILGDY